MRMWPLDELDALVRHFDEGYTISHDEAYRRFAQNAAAPPSDLPADPFDPEYRAKYLRLHETLSGRGAYTVANEGSGFDLDQVLLRPFPYFTKSVKLAATHFTLMGKLLEILDLKEGSRILECGFGWGNTTLALAMLGHNVTGLDIEANYCELVRRRAEREGVEIDLINADYLWVETAEQMFDAVIFFESFHHCWDFERLLRGLHRVLAPGGKVYFAAEPINEGFSVPWGVRLDGESLYVARKCGWMELGFHSDFFAELLQRTGWRGVCIHPHFWVAQQADEPMTMTFAGGDRRLCSQTGEAVGDALVISAPGSASERHFGVYGPYVTLPRGHYRARITLADAFSFPDEVVMDVCHSGGTVVASRTFTPLDPVLACEFELAQTFEFLEVRLNLAFGSSCSVRELAIEAIPLTRVPRQTAAGARPNAKDLDVPGF